MTNYILIYLLLFSPGNIGLLVINSAKIQPADQISTVLLYLFHDSKTSGDLYHLVVTYSVIKLFFFSFNPWKIGFDNPKSQIFNWQSELTRIFPGFYVIYNTTKSLWIILQSCKYLIPFKIWKNRNRIWSSDNVSSLLSIVFKSASINSYTIYLNIY